MGELDFLMSEAFWMEQIIAAGITAIVTLLVALLAVGPKIGELNKDLEKHAGNLARDHQDLKHDFEKGQQAVYKDVAFLRDAQLKEDARREQLQGQQLDTQKMIDALRVLMDHVADLERENKELREENTKLRERQTPFSQSWRPANEQDEEPEI